jgi:carbonic anhydrase
MMDSIVQRMSNFRDEVFPRERGLYRKLARDGQQPQALVISCADSRVVPELITQSGPGELFVCRNAGNIVPPFAQGNGGVSSAIEYAILALGVRDVVVCGHSDCGAMKALLTPGALDGMPNVAAWLRHSHAAHEVVRETCPSGLDATALARLLAMENVIAQLNHLRTHPTVAAKLAAGRMRLHGWFFDLETGAVLVLDETFGRFVEVDDECNLPVALSPAPRGGTSPLPAVAE